MHRKTQTSKQESLIGSPKLFNIYMSDFLFPKKNSINLIAYEDAITITFSNFNTHTATQNLLRYLNEIHKWAYNNFRINPHHTHDSRPLKIHQTPKHPHPQHSHLYHPQPHHPWASMTLLLLPIIEYPNTIWSPIISPTFLNKIQKNKMQL